MSNRSKTVLENILKTGAVHAGATGQIQKYYTRLQQQQHSLYNF